MKNRRPSNLLRGPRNVGTEWDTYDDDCTEEFAQRSFSLNEISSASGVRSSGECWWGSETKSRDVSVSQFHPTHLWSIVSTEERMERAPSIVIHWTYRCFPFIQEHLLLGLLLRVVVVIFYSLIINSDAQIGSTQLQSIIRRQRRHQQHNAADSFSERPMRLFPMISDKDVRWCVAVHSAVWRRKWAE